jgi:hypothetical protein
MKSSIITIVITSFYEYAGFAITLHYHPAESTKEGPELEAIAAIQRFRFEQPH